MSTLPVVLACAAGAVATLLVLSAAARIRFRVRPGSFRCRLSAGPSGRRRAAWRVRRTRAVWVHDVLLVQAGVLRTGVTVLPARVDREAAVHRLPPYAVRGLGRQAVALRLTTDEDRPLVVATASRDRTALAGPFLTACVPGAPRAPREHGT
ncbi:hypothetical protein [Blastococcus sp. SYSU D01042]